MTDQRLLTVGRRVRWHIRFDVHEDHGGYTSTRKAEGVIRSVYRDHFMVERQVGKGKHPVSPRCAVFKNDPSIEIVGDHLEQLALAGSDIRHGLG